jgi:hypothetical protein
MAKATAVRIVRVPQPVYVRGGAMATRGRKAVRAVGRGVRRMASAAGDSKHLTGALLGAAGFGLLRRYAPSVVTTLTVGGLPPEIVGGAVLLFAGKGNRMARHAATGLLAVGVAQLVQSFGGTSGVY